MAKGNRGGHSASGKGFQLQKGSGGNLQPLNVAGMTRGVNGGSLRYVSTEETLRQYESSKLNKPNEQLAILDDNGFIIKAYEGDKHSVGYIGSETTGKVVTHNHPDKYGGTFSEADVAGFLEFNQKEIRASAKEGTYSLRETRKGSGQKDALNKAYAKAQSSLYKKAESALLKVKNSGGSKTAQRKAYVDVYHNWYKDTFSKYGYTYTFTKNKGYKVK